MRRLGSPEIGTAILREMSGVRSAEAPPFECLVFNSKDGDVKLPAAAGDQEFRLYRAGDLILLRNTSPTPLWVRGKPLPKGAFLRVRERQEISVPGWVLAYEDLRFFLDSSKMGGLPTLFLEAGEEGLIAERTQSRSSDLRIRFGLQAEIEALSAHSPQVGSHGPLKKGEVIRCAYHERITGSENFSLTVDDLRKRVLQSGRRFRLVAERQEYIVSNDAAALGLGDLLISPKLAPHCVLFIRYDGEGTTGLLTMRMSAPL